VAHVLGEASDAGSVAGGQVDAAVDTEAAVPPGADLGGEVRLDAVGVQQQAKDVVFPDPQEWFVGEVSGDGVESAVRGERAVGDQGRPLPWSRSPIQPGHRVTAGRRTNRSIAGALRSKVNATA
jgi:hypothetical protein